MLEAIYRCTEKYNREHDEDRIPYERSHQGARCVTIVFDRCVLY